MPVIDVPGIGQVYAEGFAEEQTMQRILAALQGRQDPGGAASVQTAGINQSLQRLGQSSQQAAGSVKSGSDSLYSSMINAGSATDTFVSRLQRSTNRFIFGMSNAADAPFGFAAKLTEAAATMSAGSKVVGMAFGALAGDVLADLMGSTDQIVKGSALVGGALAGFFAPGMTVTATAGLLGFLFEKLNATAQEFANVTQSGAILGGSLVDFRLSAHASGLTMKEFSAIMKENSQAMSYFGGQTTRGAREFARANSALTNEFSVPMQQMGYSFQDMGNETAQMMEQFAMAGYGIDQMALRTREVAAATFEHAQTTKVLAALNGKTIEQQKEAQRQVRRDAQAQAVIARLGPQMQDRVQQVIAAFPHMRDAILDQVQFGRATSAEAMRQASLMPTAFAAVTGSIDQIKGGALNTEAALGSYIEMAKNSAQMREEYLNLTDVAALSRFTTNAYVKAAEQSVLPAQDMMARAINNTSESVVEDMKKLAAGSGEVTQKLFTQVAAQRDLTIQLGTAATGMLSRTGGLIDKVIDLTQTAANTVAAVNQAFEVPTSTRVGGYNSEVEIRRLNQMRQTIIGDTQAGATPPAPGSVTNQNGAITMAPGPVLTNSPDVVDAVNNQSKQLKRVADRLDKMQGDFAP